jgi:hypothetical protein
MTGMAGAAGDRELLADVSWAARALELYKKTDVKTALAEIGPEHMQLFHNAMGEAAANPALPQPGDPDWEYFLSYLQAGAEERLGSPLDSPQPDTGTTVTLTEVYGDERTRPRFS